MNVLHQDGLAFLVEFCTVDPKANDTVFQFQIILNPISFGC